MDGRLWIAFFDDMERAFRRMRERLEIELATTPEPDVPIPDVRGKQQEAVLRLSQLKDRYGLTTSQISDLIGGYDEANASGLLVRLQEMGVIELVPGSAPKRWRIPNNTRTDLILLASRVIEKGEWTTYGMVSVAVYGHRNGSQAVGHVAARHPAFANPHRVIGSHGIVPKEWRGYGGGPERCAEMLEREGVEFRDGRAVGNPVPHEDICERLAQIGVLPPAQGQ